jgi:hypothetical protein
MRSRIWRAALAVTAATAIVAPVARAGGLGVSAGLDANTVALLASLNLPAAPDHRQVLAVYGDAPYGTTPTDTTQFEKTPGFIDTVNADPEVSTVLHVGDIHSGKQYCTEAYDRSVFDLWKDFDDPLVYTPGDNEWADCHKAAQGGGTYNAATGAIDYILGPDGQPVDYAKGNPVANLGLVRQIFFADPNRSLGAHRIPVLSQSYWATHVDRRNPTDAKFVENAIFVRGRTLVVTIDLPGGSDNDADVWYGAPAATAEQVQEAAERTSADLRWLDVAFRAAKASKVISSVVIQAQADMWDPEKGAAHQANYEPFVKKVADDTKALRKPVLMLNGDSHVYQAGNPLVPDNPIHPGYDVPNFERIVVNGSTLPLEWLKLVIDPRVNVARTDTAFGPFSWTREPQPQL